MTNKKIELLLVDPLAERGHILTTKYFIEEEIAKAKDDIILFCSYKYKNELNVSGNYKHIGLFHVKGYNRWFALLLHIINLFIVYAYIIVNFRGRVVRFLSYENYSMAIFAWALSKICSLELFCHNNFDLRTRFSHKIANDFCARFALNLVYMQYISDHLELNFSYRTRIIRHPLFTFCDGNDCQQRKNICLYFGVFSHDELSSILDCARRDPETDFYIRCETDAPDLPENVRFVKYLDNFDYLIINSRSIYIKCCYEYRVSGLAFIAIANKVPLYMNSSLFATNLMLEYPESTVKICDPSGILL
jgi:hypothetical protein